VSDASAGSAPDRSQLLADARARLAAGTERVLGERLVAEGRRPADGSGWFDVTDHSLSGRCPAQFAHPEPSVFSEFTTPMATRNLGRFVLQRWDGSRPVGDVTAELLDRSDDLPQWLANGLESLDRSARAAVAASVTAWALDAVSAVRSRPDLIWDGRNQKVNLDPYAVTLSARWDARLGDVRAPTTLLVHSGRVADRAVDELQAGFVALVACFRGRAVPERVRFSTAGTGRTRAVGITADVLGRAVDRVLQLLGHAVQPDAAEFVAGRWCTWCHLADECDVGQRFLGG
jgi:hypothetical protein